MDKRKQNNIDPWDEGVYGTGRTEPPKSNSNLIALMMIIIIFLSGIISGLSFLNIRLFRQLQQAQSETDTISMAFSQLETAARAESLPLEEYLEAAAVRIPCLELEGEYITPFDQRYFNWPAGMLITALDAGGKAQSLGLEVGDILTRINGTAITSQAELDDFLSTANLNTALALTIQRDGRELILSDNP